MIILTIRYHWSSGEHLTEVFGNGYLKLYFILRNISTFQPIIINSQFTVSTENDKILSTVIINEICNHVPCKHNCEAVVKKSKCRGKIFMLSSLLNSFKWLYIKAKARGLHNELIYQVLCVILLTDSVHSLQSNVRHMHTGHKSM